MKNHLNRREVMFALAASAGLNLLQRAPLLAQQAAVAPPQESAPVPVGISIGAWEIPAPAFTSFSSEAEKTPANSGSWKDKFKKGVNIATDGLKQTAQAAKNAASKQHYLHMFLNVNDGKGNIYEVHALPLNPLTKNLQDFNTPDAQMRVLVLTPEQSAKIYSDLNANWKNHDLQKMPAQVPDALKDHSLTADFGKIADFGLGIDAARIPFQLTTNEPNAQPINGNAFVAGALSILGVCPPDKCPDLKTLFSGFSVPGIDNGLANNPAIHVMPALQIVGKQKGVTIDAIATQFAAGYPPPGPVAVLPAPASRTQQPGPAPQ